MHLHPQCDAAHTTFTPSIRHHVYVNPLNTPWCRHLKPQYSGEYLSSDTLNMNGWDKMYWKVQCIHHGTLSIYTTVYWRCKCHKYAQVVLTGFMYTPLHLEGSLLGCMCHIGSLPPDKHHHLLLLYPEKVNRIFIFAFQHNCHLKCHYSRGP